MTKIVLIVKTMAHSCKVIVQVTLPVFRKSTVCQVQKNQNNCQFQIHFDHFFILLFSIIFANIMAIKKLYGLLMVFWLWNVSYWSYKTSLVYHCFGSLKNQHKPILQSNVIQKCWNAINFYSQCDQKKNIYWEYISLIKNNKEKTRTKYSLHSNICPVANDNEMILNIHFRLSDI